MNCSPLLDWSTKQKSKDISMVRLKVKSFFVSSEIKILTAIYKGLEWQEWKLATDIQLTKNGRFRAFPVCCGLPVSESAFFGGRIMEYVSVKNLEKYLPGYTDRTFAWLKLYFRDTKDQKSNTKHTGIFNDVEFQDLNEIDRYRFLSLACMQGNLGNPVPLTSRYISWMGWNTKKRPKSETLQMLHNFIVVTGEPVTQMDVTQSKIKNKNRIEKSRGLFKPPTLSEISLFIEQQNYKYVNSESFFNFYESKGWVVGKSKMKDWKKAVAGWESREKQKHPKPTPQKREGECFRCGILTRNWNDQDAKFWHSADCRYKAIREGLIK